MAETTTITGSEVLDIARGCPLVLPADPTAIIEPTVPEKLADGFKLKQLYVLLDCQTIDVIRIPGTDMIFIIDDDGKFREPCLLNQLATAIWHEHLAPEQRVDFLAGTVVLCHTDMLQ